jgi:hypothetical protein
MRGAIIEGQVGEGKEENNFMMKMNEYSKKTG